MASTPLAKHGRASFGGVGRHQVVTKVLWESSNQPSDTNQKKGKTPLRGVAHMAICPFLSRISAHIALCSTVTAQGSGHKPAEDHGGLQHQQVAGTPGISSGHVGDPM